MSSFHTIQKFFLSAPRFAVVGASKDQSKFGTKVLKWYKAREFQVTPVHPKEQEIEGLQTVSSIDDLPQPKETSVSIVTPPQITLTVLRQANALSVPAIWLQPGAEDEAVVEYIKSNNLSDKVIYGGPCILSEGDNVVRSMLQTQQNASLTLPFDDTPLIMLKLWLSLTFLNCVLTLSSAQGNPTIAAAWWTSWHARDFPLEQLSWSKYTHLIYAFATTTPNITALGFSNVDQTLLPQFVNHARNHNVIPMLSIGGYTGSRWFSSHVRTSENRTAFAKTITDVVNMYNLGGIDFDWEFPNDLGVGCNVVNGDDTVNFLAFLHQLRNTTAGSKMTISAAAGITPWVDTNGRPSQNLSDFKNVLDFLTLMSYDISSNSSFGAGPSSPLDDSCAPISARKGSVKSAVSSWSAAGFPTNQLVLGVPSYGHSYSILPGGSGENTSTTLPMYPSYTRDHVRGDKWDAFGNETDVCGLPLGSGGTYEYWGLIDRGFLNADGSPQAGIRYRFDNCSKTPFVYNTTSKIYVSYDDPVSFAHKGEYIRTAGLKGFAMWEAGGDYKDALLDSILNAIRNTSSPSATSPSLPTSRGVALPLHLIMSWSFTLVTLTWLGL